MNEPQGAGIIAKNETGPSETFIYITAVMEVFFGTGGGISTSYCKNELLLTWSFYKKKRKGSYTQ